jgi:2-methylcitrate dehydratase PrpD
MAERLQATADDLLSAIAIGYDVGVRIAAAQNTGAIKTHQSGRWAAFAAVAAAARLMKCKPEQISHALSIAGVLAPNQEANGSSGYSKLTGNDVKEGIPWSAATGLTALYLAKKGHTGPEDILDAGDYYDRERIMAGMGAHFEIVDTYFKPYSCCRYIHPALDGFLAIITRYSLKPEEIVAVDVETFDWALKLNNTTEPRNLVDVQYSLPYCLAIAAIDRRDAFAPLKPGVLNRPDLSQFANKVRLNVAADIDALFPAETLARVVVRTERRQLASSIQPPYGDPKNPMLWDAIEDKFIRVAGAALSPERQREIVDGILNLAAGDTATLLRSLR